MSKHLLAISLLIIGFIVGMGAGYFLTPQYQETMYDEKLDLRFLNALIAHHEAGILMTQEIRTKSSRIEVLNNADAVENFLKTTRITLRESRKAWYNID